MHNQNYDSIFKIQNSKCKNQNYAETGGDERFQIPRPGFQISESEVMRRDSNGDRSERKGSGFEGDGENEGLDSRDCDPGIWNCGIWNLIRNDGLAGGEGPG
jgi:hypothetical protein